MLCVFGILMVLIEPLRRAHMYHPPLPAPARFVRASYRNQALEAGDRQDGVVALRSPRRGVDEDVQPFVDGRGGGALREHHVQVRRFKHLLTRVECEAGQLALDEVRAVLHDGLELDVPVGRLPPVREGAAAHDSVEKEELAKTDERDAAGHASDAEAALAYPSETDAAKGNSSDTDTVCGRSSEDGYSLWDEVESVDTVRALSLLDALITGELDLLASEEGQAGDLVPELDQPSVKVDLVPQRGDGDERGVAHEEEGSYGLLSSSDSEWQSVSDTDSSE